MRAAVEAYAAADLHAEGSEVEVAAAADVATH